MFLGFVEWQGIGIMSGGWFGLLLCEGHRWVVLSIGKKRDGGQSYSRLVFVFSFVNVNCFIFQSVRSVVQKANIRVMLASNPITISQKCYIRYGTK